MASQKQFSLTPSVSITRSKFHRTSQHKTTFRLGDIVPVYVDEVLPGDTRSMNLNALVRMVTPITDLMDNIDLEFFAFFCPSRLLLDDFKKFMGENETGYGAQSDIILPLVKIGDPSDDANFIDHSRALGLYMGLPYTANFTSGPDYNLAVSPLPLRGYVKIYNDWFRDQNIIAPIPVDTGLNTNIVVGNDFGYGSEPLKAAKHSDYFTRALPYAQKGDPVSLPLGTKAPVVIAAGSPSGSALVNGISSGSGTEFGTTLNAMYNNIDKGPIYADLQEATAATINDLRFAFQYQKLLEKDALYGTRYWEILKAHFGITAPDASLQRPQYLGGKRVPINITQVTSTAGADFSSQQKLGAIGGVSVTGVKSDLFTFSSVEHGYLYILAVARHDQSYCQGVNRMWTRQHRFDYYWPVFANLGAQEIKNKEICAYSNASDDLVFGYQESWAEYRYRPSIVSGNLNPTVAASLPYWTLVNKFDSVPTLGKTFIEQDRVALGRALTTGVNGDFDFLADFYFDEIAVRPMPMYSVPGFIDHH